MSCGVADWHRGGAEARSGTTWLLRTRVREPRSVGSEAGILKDGLVYGVEGVNGKLGKVLGREWVRLGER